MKATRFISLVCLLLSGFGIGHPATQKSATSQSLEFFETSVRPVLSDNCFACHGTKLQMSGLRLDSREAMLKGTSSGHVVLVPGDPEKSSLIRVIRYDSQIKMPPKAILPKKDIDALTAWVQMGAPWPETKVADQKPQLEAWRKHWSFQPVTKPAIPIISDQQLNKWSQTAIDRLVIAKLLEKKMRPSKYADRPTLIRRATYDLTGLPTRIEDIEAFCRDDSPDAFAKVVDRLLGSQEFGERWGRYWLDVARYADTKGYIYESQRRYPFAYTYRDWVVSAFNQDLPYDQFVLHQIASDQLPNGDDKRSLAAMGFLTLGRRFVNMQPDIIDDRMDVVFRGLQGLTIGCARCHDHKFDPIPTKDYYSIYGVFASCREDLTRVVAPPRRTEKYISYEKELQAREQALENALQAKTAELSDRLRAKVADYLTEVLIADQLPGDDFYAIMTADDINPLIVRRWVAYLVEKGKKFDPIFGPWHAFASLDNDGWARKAGELAKTFAANATSDRPINRFVAELFREPPSSMRDVAKRYGDLLGRVNTAWLEAVKTSKESNTAPPEALPNPDQEALRQVLYGSDSPTNVPRVRFSEIVYMFDEPTRNEMYELQAKVDLWHIESKETPPHALVLQDVSTPYNPRVFIRGNPGNRGEEVPRQFLGAIAGNGRQPFHNGSGRLELAQAIANRNNPLTARVFVNRVWSHLFGEGLVKTPSDFGLRSEPPANLDLLNYLSWRFMEDGWSMKKLIRLIMLSSVYQQASDDLPAYRQIDPEDSLLWRVRSRRFDFEGLRDSLLFMTGQLDGTMGGPSVDLTAYPFPMRRTVYGFIDRLNLPETFRIFDFANPDSHIPKRYTTTVPQQALFMLNSPFVIQIARQVLSRPEISNEPSQEGKSRGLYRLIYGRDPTPREIELAVAFVNDRASDDAGSHDAPLTWQYGFGKFDEPRSRVTEFQPFTYFSGDAWQAGPVRPDAQYGSLSLEADGGHPGNDAQHAVIGRWTAPRDGIFEITGVLNHESEKGDGVQARVVSSRTGLAGSWTAQKNKVDTKIERLELKQGDTVDFVVDCRTGPEGDAFSWPHKISILGGGTSDQSSATMPSVWDSSNDFHGPILNRWEQLVQVLLMSNEFSFIN